MTGVLDGLRILDMSTVVMGPYATQILGDLGADIIKVETPDGDNTRQIGPMRNPKMGYPFLNLNRNKRSIVLDLKKKGGIDAFMRLAATVDAFISNVRPKALARLGVTWEALSVTNPRLVMISLVGFGQDGPYAEKPVYEDLIQGLTAVPSMMMDAGANQPLYVPVTFNDHAVGQAAAIALLAAIRHRDKTGRGQEVQVPMFEVMAQATLNAHLGGLAFDPPLGPPGYRRVLNNQRRPYATGDGYICIIIYTDRHWRAFFELVDRPEWHSDPRLADFGTRTLHSVELYKVVAEEMLKRPTEAWLEALEGADIPATRLHTLESLIADPHLSQTGFFEMTSHPSEGRVRQMTPPLKFSEGHHEVRRPAPRLGEHSAELLQEVGYSQDQVAGLAAAGAVVLAGAPQHKG